MPHTSGPWEHAIEQDGENRNICVFAAENRGIICDIGGGEFDERLANARLIAAAPELLAACKWALTNAMAAGNEWTPYCNAIRSAVNKATGQ